MTAEAVRLEQIRLFIVRPAIERLGHWSPAAEQLVMATGMAESGFQFIDQVDKASKPGPAYGWWQMEMPTDEDIWGNYLRYRNDLAMKVRQLMILTISGADNLHGNMFYAAAMCRLQYLRAGGTLPDIADIDGAAAYWKKHYNTVRGAGTVESFRAKAAPVYQST